MNRPADAMSLASSLAPARAWWHALGARERRMLAIGAAVLGLYLVYAVGVRPAWRTVSEAPSRIDALDLQLQDMRALAAETQQLRGAPQLNTEQSIAALKAATARLGDKGRLSLQGERAVLTVNGASSGDLRAWLAESRSGARARPLEAQLTRGTGGYSGSITLAIGAAP